MIVLSESEKEIIGIFIYSFGVDIGIIILEKIVIVNKVKDLMK